MIGLRLWLPRRLSLAIRETFNSSVGISEKSVRVIQLIFLATRDHRHSRRERKGSKTKRQTQLLRKVQLLSKRNYYRVCVSNLLRLLAKDELLLPAEHLVDTLAVEHRYLGVVLLDLLHQLLGSWNTINNEWCSLDDCVKWLIWTDMGECEQRAGVMTVLSARWEQLLHVKLGVKEQLGWQDTGEIQAQRAQHVQHAAVFVLPHLREATNKSCVCSVVVWSSWPSYQSLPSSISCLDSSWLALVVLSTMLVNPIP